MTQQHASLHSHPLFVELARLDLPDEDYILAGSGPLLARGIRADITDLDVVVRGRAWDIARRLGPVVTAPWEGVRRVVLYGGSLDVLNGWFPSMWDLDEFIETREYIDGLPFAPLDRVLRWKRRLGRAKDIADINALMEHLVGRSPLTPAGADEPPLTAIAGEPPALSGTGPQNRIDMTSPTSRKPTRS
ncbi:hypothetical protein [Nocardiopsis baichengensis]|uniref:hypothetical protein n=1 Tax=Nocardiopsis baichengensis TaxID=280240 RepID=UPI00036B6EE9|nr:hypothetical protein [Nocardiopsis baichengensis]